MSKDLDVYLTRLPQRVTDNIFLQWKTKYQQDDALLETEIWVEIHHPEDMNDKI